MQHLKNTFENITGVEIYPLISLMIFFLFFVALGLYVIGTPKKYFDEMGKAPLDDADKHDSQNSN